MNIEEAKLQMKKIQNRVCAKYGVNSINDLSDEQFDEYYASEDGAEISRMTRELCAAAEKGHTGVRVSDTRKRCPKCGNIVTATGKCDDCSDWDN